METSLPRDLMSDDAWSLFEHFILAIRAQMAVRQSIIALFWMEYSGPRALGRLDAT